MTILPTLIYSAAKWMLRNRAQVNTGVLLDLFQGMDGRVRDELGTIVPAFTTIPFKKSIELPTACEEVMVEIADRLISFNLRKAISGLSSNVVFNVGMLDILEFSVADPYTAIVLRPA